VNKTARWCVACAALAVFAPACAKKTVVIENRYAKGEELTYRLLTKGSGTTSMSGLPGRPDAAEMPIGMEMELLYRTTVKDVDARGAAEIETSFERFSSVNESGALKVRIEADAKGARIIQGETVTKEAPGLDGLKALFARPTAFTMDKRGRVLSVARPGGVAAILPQMDLHAFLKHGQFLLPDGPVAAGNSWVEQRTLSLGEAAGGKAEDAGTLVLDIRYTFVRLTTRGGRRCAEIALQGEMDAKDVAVSLPLTGPGGAGMKTVFDRLRQRLNGTLFFDLGKGCAAELRVETEQDVTMTMRLDGPEGEARLSTVTKMKTDSTLKLVE